jgi:RNA polymerase sigma-70 factor (ECF subfamily)
MTREVKISKKILTYLSFYLSLLVIYIQTLLMNFEEIYTKYYRKLYGLAYQYTHSRQDSEDLVHEAFSRFWKELQKGSGIQNERAWLYKVLLNLIKTSKSRDKLFKGKLQKIESNTLKSEDSQSEYLLNEKRRIINEELDLLPDAEKSILILYNQDLRYEEIAQIMDMNIGSVGTTLARAINKFRINLKTKYNGLFE